MTIDEQDVVDFYKNAELDDAHVDAILASGQHVVSARRWKRIAIASMVALAATLVVVVGVLSRNADAPHQNDQQQAARPDEGVNAVVRPSAEVEQPATTYRLAAFRSHNDQCPHCRATGELYQTLSDRFADASIEFEKFELQDRARLDDTNAKIKARGLGELVEGKQETAFAVLLSPTGKVLQRFKGTDDVQSVQTKIANVIDQ